MNPDRPDSQETLGLRSMMIPTIVIIGVMLANCIIIWFLLVDLPSRCARLAMETYGSQTCGMEIGAYLIASISAVMVLGGVYYIAKWRFLPDE
jgi:hypothetical protein